MTADEFQEIDALVLHGAKDLRLEKRQATQPRPGEVQVSIKATGLCGSDLHYYHHGRNGNFVLQHPMCLGHEAAGIVSAVAVVPETNGTTHTPTTTSSSSSSLKIGDRVALEVGIPCRQCHLCITGRYNLCPKLRFRSSAKTHPHLDGTLQTSITHLESLCHRLPDNVTYEQGALVEPLAVSLHAINRSLSAGSNTSTPLAGSTALILGAGAVGILTAVALSVSGVSKIVICDIDQSRLDIVTALSSSSNSKNRFNLTPYLLPKPDLTQPKPTAEAQLTISAKQADDLIDFAFSADPTSPTGTRSREGFDRTFECTGLPSCVATSIHATTPGGKVILVGMGNPVQTLPLGAAALREIDIIGVFRYANCYPAAIELFATGKLDGVAEAVVTHRVELTNPQTSLAFRLASNSASEQDTGGRAVVKVMVVPKL